MPAFRKALLLYNPLAGGGAGERAIAAASRIFRDAGVEVELEATRGRGEAGRQACEAVPRGFDAIFACGGDGTVYEVLQGMVHTPAEVALGVLPLGTANVLAADLGLPDRLEAAARSVLDYLPRRIATGRLSWENRAPRYFEVAAGIGGHAELIYHAARGKRNGGFVAYYVSGMSQLFSHNFVPLSAEITLPDGSICHKEVLELVAMRVSSFGHWLRRWRPGGGLDRDYLQLITLKPCSRWKLFRYVVSAVVSGASPERVSCVPEVEFTSVLSVRCRPLESAKVRAQADGEVLESVPSEIAIVPQSLTLLMPPTSTGE